MQFPLPYTYFTTFAFATLTFELLDVRLELIEMVDAVVGYAQGADFASLLRFNQGTPGAIAAFFTTVWGVYQISAIPSSAPRLM